MPTKPDWQYHIGLKHLARDMALVGAYPYWDALVKGVQADIAVVHGDEVDAEIFCAILLSSAILGPRVFKNRICPQDSVERVMERFRKETQRMLGTEGFLKS
jgi:hypothetical protein